MGTSALAALLLLDLARLLVIVFFLLKMLFK